ncbi:kinase-like protein [Marasmius fiardii PR-910]|nr:kinase-like protein [Marasmius fiardii PR-910]
MTGRPPFPDLHDVAVITQVLFNQARPERPSGVWCPENVWELVQKCWDQDRLKRPTATYVHNYLAGLTETDTSLDDDDSDDPRYPGWLSEVLKPLEEFIDEPIDPREYYHDLEAIGEGESGMVFVARVTETGNIHKLKLPPLIKAHDAYNQVRGLRTLVAIKSVEIVPEGMTKIEDLRNELQLLEGLSTHLNVLRMDALYVDLVEDSLWIRMELMEMSLADVVELVDDDAGLAVLAPLQQNVIARFAGDVLDALCFLQSHRIAHRDLRSDNLLLNSEGVLKLASFEYAIKLPIESSLAFDPVGVFYWQVRSGAYDALKVDVCSLGATVWEVAQLRPPFADLQSDDPGLSITRLPPLDEPHLYSADFSEFLRLCCESPSLRPSPNELVKNPFVEGSCGRSEIQRLVKQCLAIEQERGSGDL